MNRIHGSCLWLPLAVALFCAPARAQYAYSTLDSDSAGDLAGYSVEDVGYEWEGLYSAVVDGQIQGPSGTYSYSIGYDDGSGYAEADNSAEADVEGQYTETGTDWEI